MPKLRKITKKTDFSAASPLDTDIFKIFIWCTWTKNKGCYVKHILCKYLSTTFNLKTKLIRILQNLVWKSALYKVIQELPAGCRPRPFEMQLLIGKIHPLTVTFEPVMPFGCPSRFRQFCIIMTYSILYLDELHILKTFFPWRRRKAVAGKGWVT